MHFRFIVFLCFIYLNSCQNDKKKSDLKFKEVLHKIHQCEAYNELKFGNADTLFLENCKQSAMKEVQMSNEQFIQSMNYYTQHPKEFEELYDTLLLKYP
jgi:hypothetical protein